MIAIAVPLLVQLFALPAARAWDSRTHEMITRLAVEAMPPSAFKMFLQRNEKLLEHLSVEPDSKLKRLYGEAEQRRHFIDIDFYGSGDPFSQLDPSLANTEEKFGKANVERWGTLPWTIEEFSNGLSQQLGQSVHSRNCATILMLAGYLAHYVGDSTQPLHATSHFDGFAQDRGVHHRIEDATDHEAARLGDLARSACQTRDIGSVWIATLAELRHSHTLVMQLIAGDRAARAASHGNFDSYERELMRREGAMIAGQIARGATLLASIWFYEWERAGRPAVCNASVRIRRSAQSPTFWRE